jgi:hypothetical protein
MPTPENIKAQKDELPLPSIWFLEFSPSVMQNKRPIMSKTVLKMVAPYQNFF